MTIIFFTGIFTAKAVEYNYTKKQLYIFGLSVGLATFIFMSMSVLISFFFKRSNSSFNYTNIKFSCRNSFNWIWNNKDFKESEKIKMIP